MSRNGSGVYSLPPTNPVVPGSTISTVWANGTMTDIATALTGSVASDGQTPMTGNLNLNSNKIVGLAAGTVAGNAIEYAQFSTPTFTGDVTCTSTGYIQIPAGTTAQRPSTAAAGEIRYNTTTGQYEGYVAGIDGQAISGISHVTVVATVTTIAPHGLSTGASVVVSGATPSQYNGSYTITVTSDTEFTYTMGSDPGSNATVVGSYTYGAWSQIGGGATGGGSDQVFVENTTVVTTSYALPLGKNASSVGPITINSGKTVTIPSSQRWVIL
jgi:hypothetical protein